MTFAVPETAGVGTGPIGPSSRLSFTQISAANPSGVIGGFDVSGFAAILVSLNMTLGTFLSLVPIWSDPATNTNLYGSSLLTPTNAVVTPGAPTQLLAYRCMTPFVTIAFDAVGSPFSAAVSVFGINIPLRYDVYTPGVSGAVLAQTDSLAASAQLAVLGYCGPAKFHTIAGTQITLQYQDTSANWHGFGAWNQLSAAGIVETPFEAWVPPVPVRLNNTGTVAAPVALLAA